MVWPPTVSNRCVQSEPSPWRDGDHVHMSCLLWSILNDVNITNSPPLVWSKCINIIFISKSKNTTQSHPHDLKSIGSDWANNVP